MRQNNDYRSVRRRTILKTTGGGLAAGLATGFAGCLGDDDDDVAPADDDDDDTAPADDDDGDDADDPFANYPEQTIVFINPSGPEGGFGSTSYAFEPIFPEYLPNPDGDMVVESIGSWPQGTQQIHEAEPDGYTIGWMNIPGLIVDDRIGGLPFDFAEWSYIGVVQAGTYSCYVTVDSEYETFDDVLEEDEILIPRFGGTGELVNLLATSTVGVPFEPVPGYGGGDDAYAGLLRGEVDVLWYAQDSTLPRASLADGEIRPLVTLAEEVPQHYVDAGYGDIPTISEYGHDELTGFGLTRGVGGPGGIDDELLDILEDALLSTLDDDEFLAWADEANYELHPGGREACETAVENGVEIVEGNRDLLEQFYG